jgi:putative membrane protein
MVCTKWITSLAAVTVLLTWTSANAQAGAQTPGGERPQMSIPADAKADSNASDKMFLTHAAQGSEAEVELGKLAQDKAADAKVKEFGARMQADHSKSGAEVRGIIAKKGITVPGGLGPHMALKNRLDKLQGANFDQAYMKAMVEAHSKNLREFETAAKSTDADVRAFATKTLPTLREHLRLAQEVAKGASSTMPSSAPAAGDSKTKGQPGGAPY